jgi:hypothetical protein
MRSALIRRSRAALWFAELAGRARSLEELAKRDGITGVASGVWLASPS